MDGQYSWKRTREMEIDLADLLKRLCMQWKQMLICALAFTVLAGGYGYVKNRHSMKIQDADAAAETELTEEEAQKVASALELEQEIKGLESYLDGSVLMHTDPYHKHKAYMLYSAGGAGSRNVQKITECYLNYITNGGAFRQLQKIRSSWNIDKCYLSEIISAYRKTYETSYQVITDEKLQNEEQAEALFYVEITGTDAKMVSQLADDMKTILADYCKKIKDRAGSHKLELLGTQNTMIADSSLQTLQHDKKTQLESARANLKAITDGFSDMQLAVYRKDSFAGNEIEKLPESSLDGEGKTDADEVSGISFKYIFLGLACGVFVYCCIYTCRYLLSDTVKSETEVKEIYQFPLFGKVSFESKDGKKISGRSDAAKTAFKQSEAQLLNRIRLACRNQGITKLCAASDFLFDGQEKESLEGIAGQLERFGIHTVVAENAVNNTDIWDTLIEAGTVLLVCKIGTTTHRMMDDAMRFYTENGISVLGAMIFY